MWLFRGFDRSYVGLMVDCTWCSSASVLGLFNLISIMDFFSVTYVVLKSPQMSLTRITVSPENQYSKRITVFSLPPTGTTLSLNVRKTSVSRISRSNTGTLTFSNRRCIIDLFHQDSNLLDYATRYQYVLFEREAREYLIISLKYHCYHSPCDSFIAHSRIMIKLCIEGHISSKPTM